MPLEIQGVYPAIDAMKKPPMRIERMSSESLPDYMPHTVHTGVREN
jgi:hypothetical protein